MFQKQRKKAKDKKQYKKGKETTVETNRHCKRAKTAPKRQRMIQHRIKKRVNFQRAKSKMPKSKGKRAKEKAIHKNVRKRLLKQTDIEKERVLPQKDSE